MLKTMKSQPLVSIVTPAYNQAEFLLETVESVLGQSYSNIEYIVIDDGSTDATGDIVKALPKHVVTVQQANSGQAATLNRGWAMARGNYLAYLSSDDLLYRDAITELVTFLEANPNVVCAYPDSDLIDSKSRVVKRNVCRPFDLDELIVRQECYIGPGAVFRKSGFECAGGWRTDLKLGPDREFWIRLARNGRIEFVAQTLAGYRLHGNSISNSEVSEAVAREFVRVIEDHFAAPEMLPTGLAERKHEALGYATLILARNCFRAGNARRGLGYYREACEYHPPLGRLAVKAGLLRNVVSKPIRIWIDRLKFHGH
jgi:glycosyltransferase involved in cell wall biosynthesis